MCFFSDLLFSTLCPSFANILMGRRERVTLLFCGSWLSLTVPWVSLQYVIGVFSNQTHLLFFKCNC